MEESFSVEVLKPKIAVDSLCAASTNFPMLVECVKEFDDGGFSSVSFTVHVDGVFFAIVTEQGREPTAELISCNVVVVEEIHVFLVGVVSFFLVEAIGYSVGFQSVAVCCVGSVSSSDVESLLDFSVPVFGSEFVKEFCASVWCTLCGMI